MASLHKEGFVQRLITTRPVESKFSYHIRRFGWPDFNSGGGTHNCPGLDSVYLPNQKSKFPKPQSRPRLREDTQLKQDYNNPGVPHLRGSFPWARLGSGPLHPGGLYLGWGQGPTPSTAFDDRMGSSPPLGVEPVSMTIGPQGPYQVSYHIPS
ncbi:hypothetical protein YC2023_090202 [Brassica napus]